MKLSLKQLRRRAISTSLFQPTTLREAVKRLGFVQADPIRSPARAQDLILRQRVTNYRAGDLENRYSSLNLEEDFLYAYGFMPESTWKLLHPRKQQNLTPTERQVFEIVSSHKQIHPRDLEEYFGREREINAWGGYSKATTRILQTLHYRGLLRVGGREKGVRLYQPTVADPGYLEPAERLRQLVLLLASILGPLPATSLRGAIQYLSHGAPTLEGRRSAIPRLLNEGELEKGVLDGVEYVWPTRRVKTSAPDSLVRFLAPFDPLVWDRRRFEQLWGWPYRFEAYTPANKRKLGYYALPILWADEVIGWVNLSQKDNQLSVVPGFVKKRPANRVFENEFEAEVERFRHFLQSRRASATIS
jgi:uncharacterized protein